MRLTSTLARRIVLLGVLVAAASVAITGVATIGLYRTGATQAAQESLGRDADTVAASIALADRRPTRQQRRIRTIAANKLLSSRQITLYTVASDEVPTAAELPVPFSLAQLQAVRQNRTLSRQQSTSQGSYLIEGRITGTTTMLLAQPTDEALAQARLGTRRLVIPLLLGLLGGGLAGLLLARQITAPLGRLATAARRLSGGDRTVRVPPEGPREVADVAQALNGLAAALSDSETRQRRFLMNVSHELRTPLTAVSGYAEGLAEGVITGTEVPFAATVIRDEAARLNHRVDDLLALARMEADDFRLQIGPADLTELLLAAARAWRPRAETAGVTLQVAVGRPPIMVATDPERVRQAIDALADNALRVLPPGSTVTFDCGMQADPGGRPDRALGPADHVDQPVAWIEVRDDGPGLADEDLAGAFDRGRLTERYRGERPVGSGIGLALVGELARRLGGTAVARRADEGGVSFVIVLPVRPNPNTPRTFHEPSGHPAREE
jgi:two-component system OmpR family sensor kinase